MSKRATELADAHWGYVEQLLKAHGAGKDELGVAEFHYKSAFVHAHHHGAEDQRNGVMDDPRDEPAEVPPLPCHLCARQDQSCPPPPVRSCDFFKSRIKPGDLTPADMERIRSHERNIKVEAPLKTCISCATSCHYQGSLHIFERCTAYRQQGGTT